MILNDNEIISTESNGKCFLETKFVIVVDPESNNIHQYHDSELNFKIIKSLLLVLKILIFHPLVIIIAQTSKLELAEFAVVSFTEICNGKCSKSTS